VNPQLLAYLRENRGRYTPEALRRTLIDAGYVPTEVDEALAALAAEDAGGQPAVASSAPSGWQATTPRQDKESVSTSPRFWLVFIGYVLAVYGLGGFLAALLGGSASLVALLVVVALIAGAFGWSTKRDEDRPLAMGLGCGVLFAIGLPFIGLGVLFGLCVAGAGIRVG
jgi:hypothetical protein